MNPLEPYNPEKFDDEQLEVDDGWRCLVAMELTPGYILPKDLQYYDDCDSEWQDSFNAGEPWDATVSGITYRTQADLPMIGFAVLPTTPTPPDDPLAVILKMVKP